MKHENSGYCLKCQSIIDHYPGMNTILRDWFEKFQKQHPEAHISCAGRGEADQLAVFESGNSKAQFGESAHNYNCAIDLFVMKKGLNIYDRDWFRDVVSPNIPDFLEWYGKPGSKFYELPHIELKGWRTLKQAGLIKLVRALV